MSGGILFRQKKEQNKLNIQNAVRISALVFTPLHTYLPGECVIETTSTGRTKRSVGIGDWIRTGERQFTNTICLAPYDPRRP